MFMHCSLFTIHSCTMKDYEQSQIFGYQLGTTQICSKEILQNHCIALHKNCTEHGMLYCNTALHCTSLVQTFLGASGPLRYDTVK